MEQKVLIIDDEKELAEYTARYFNMSGVSAEYVLDSASALECLAKEASDSGFELCQTIRRTVSVPIFFISARSSEDDMLLALGIGGDDYICKPYSLGVLLAKVKAALKRCEASSPVKQKDAHEDSGTVKLGNAVIDMRRACAIRNGEERMLKAMEYKLLVYMLGNKGRIISKDEFFREVWDTEYVSEVTLNVHIRHLREKIEDDPSRPQIIKTVWGVGFILEDKK